MAATNSKRECFSCKKVTRTFNCDGCSQNFCTDCLTKHLQELKKNLHTIETDYDQFRQKLNDQKKDPKKRSLIQQVDQWEEESINKIKQTALQCRQKLINYTNKFIGNSENKLNDTTKQIKQLSQENQFNETDLEELKEKLRVLKEELDKPPNVLVQQQQQQQQQQSVTFINKLFVTIPFEKGNIFEFGDLVSVTEMGISRIQL